MKRAGQEPVADTEGTGAWKERNDAIFDDHSFSFSFLTIIHNSRPPPTSSRLHPCTPSATLDFNHPGRLDSSLIYADNTNYPRVTPGCFSAPVTCWCKIWGLGW